VTTFKFKSSEYDRFAHNDRGTLSRLTVSFAASPSRNKRRDQYER